MRGIGIFLIIVVVVALSLSACAQTTVAPAPELTPEPAPAVEPTPGTPSAPDIAPSTTPTPEPERTIECEHPYPTVTMNSELKALIDQGLMDACLSLNPFCGEDEDLATKPDGTPYKFALAHPSFQFTRTYREWNDNLEGLTKTLIGYRNGGEYFVIDEDQNLVEELLKFNPEALLINPRDGVMLAPVVEQAANAGVAIFVIENAVDTSSITSYVYRDFEGDSACNMLGQYLVELADQTGEEYQLLEIWALPGSSFDQAVHDRFHEGLADDPRIHVIVESRFEGWSDVETEEFVPELLTANPELNAVYLHGAGTFGALKGLEAIGRLEPRGHPDHVVFITNDSDSNTINSLEEGFVDAILTSGSWVLADITVKNALTSIVLGQSVMKDIPVPMDIVTLDNINSLTQFGCTPIYTKLPRGPVGAEWALWPVLDTSEIGVEIPTKAMRIELMGY